MGYFLADARFLKMITTKVPSSCSYRACKNLCSASFYFQSRIRKKLEMKLSHTPAFIDRISRIFSHNLRQITI